MVDLGSRMIGSGTNINSKKSTLDLIVLVQELNPSPKIEIHILFPSNEYEGESISRSMGTGIDVGSEN